MKPRPLWELSVTVASEAEDAASELLQRLFSTPASSYLDFKSGKAQVALMFTQPPVFGRQEREAILHGLERLRDFGLEPGRPAIRMRALRPADWAEAWKRHFKPISIGSRLLIKPGWDRTRPRTGQAVITLDPGLSFGTGQHPTTLFCLREITRAAGARARARSLLDIGTGSGILAIAAAKLGYTTVSAMDFDPQAVGTARANARRNHVQRRIRITRGDIGKFPTRGGPRYDVVCANLISTLLIAQRERILNRAAPGGFVVLAGILATEFEAVRRAYEAAGCELLRSRVQREWESGAFRCAARD
ncbi:MAG TPA: 50S ribosomal protein L11 methyltransferase [Verrucomicrobiae bacterium]|nr:50S ribosomal protein L11 methyltransferase [Verrucomicrobiae bacterium]